MMARGRVVRIVSFAGTIGLLFTVGGCKSNDARTAPAESKTISSDTAATAGANAEPQAPSPPSTRELRITQEVLLHAALYRAAFTARVGEANHIILEPVSEDSPPNLRVDPADFRSRVIVELSDVALPIAWAPSTWRTHTDDVFPGTSKPATRLTARIISRDEDQATVTSEIGDRTPDSLSSRQTVTATWDGAAWRVERGRARVVW